MLKCKFHSVDGSEIQQSPVEGTVVCPLFTRFYIVAKLVFQQVIPGVPNEHPMAGSFTWDSMKQIMGNGDLHNQTSSIT